MGSAPRKQSKTYKVPKRPYEAARLDAELKVGLNIMSLGLVDGWVWVKRVLGCHEGLWMARLDRIREFQLGVNGVRGMSKFQARIVQRDGGTLTRPIPLPATLQLQEETADV